MSFRGCRAISWVAIAIVAMIVAIGAGLLHWGGAVPLTISLTTAIVALTAHVVERHRWWRPLAEMTRHISEVRSGDCAIESLKEIDGSFSVFAVELRSLMCQLREQQRSLATLEQEMRDRIANRTDALERQMSSYRLKASTDALTGLFNRRMLDDCLPALVADCRKQRKDLTILAIDVDRFKSLNDTMGHAAGDDFLRSIGQILRSGIRDGDIAIRSGGDEFIVMLPGCSPGPARALGGRLATMVDGLARTLGKSNPPGLSVGAASLSMLDDAASPERLLAAADRDLYTVKATRSRAA